MGANNKICPNCGRKMKQQFIGLQHCKCGMSWKKDEGFFERTPNMVFALERQKSKTDSCHKIQNRKLTQDGLLRQAVFFFGKEV